MTANGIRTLTCTNQRRTLESRLRQSLNEGLEKINLPYLAAGIFLDVASLAPLTLSQLISFLFEVTSAEIIIIKAPYSRMQQRDVKNELS